MEPTGTGCIHMRAKTLPSSPVAKMVGSAHGPVMGQNMTPGPTCFPVCMCNECVRVFPAVYDVRMQMVNKSLISQVLSTGILSDTLKFDKVMIHHYLKSIARICLFSFSNDLKSIRDIFSLGRQVYLHTSMTDNKYGFIYNCTCIIDNNDVLI